MSGGHGVQPETPLTTVEALTLKKKPDWQEGGSQWRVPSTHTGSHAARHVQPLVMPAP